MVGCGKRPAHRSPSYRAGILFPVGRIHRLLRRQGSVRRVRSTASVYPAAVLEYLIAELVDVAGNVTHHFKKRRINPRHLLLAIRKDEEFNKLVARVIIPQGGVVPNIRPELMPKKTTEKKRVSNSEENEASTSSQQ